MTEKQEEIAEKIIELLKAADGRLEGKELSRCLGFKGEWSEEKMIKDQLKEKGLIEYVNLEFRLKEAGWDFKGFQAERKKQAKAVANEVIDRHGKKELTKWGVLSHKTVVVGAVINLIWTIINIFFTG